MNNSNAANATNANPLGLNVELLERSFIALAPQGETLVARFYEELFRHYPAVQPLFAGSSMAKQQNKLLGALALVVNNLRQPEVLVPMLKELGQRHQGYGAVAEHYPAVATTLLVVMRELAGPVWTDEVHKAWSEALTLVAETMLVGYAK